MKNEGTRFVTVTGLERLYGSRRLRRVDDDDNDAEEDRLYTLVVLPERQILLPVRGSQV